MTERLPHSWLDRPLLEARNWISEKLNGGESVICPCCGQHAKIYKRKINAGMAVALIKMYRHAGRDWFNLPAIHNQWQSRDEAGLRYWGLIQEARERREDGGRAGWWRVTEDGERFIRGITPEPKYALIYNGTRIGFDGDPVFIRDCLGDKFSYEELMSV